MSTAYIAGIVCGVLAVALVCWLISHINKKTGVEKKDYDERQQAIRDKGFRFAYLTLIGYMAVFALLHSIELVSGDMGGWLLIGVIVSLLVHIIYSIYMDAYFKVSDKPKSWMVFFGFLALVNIVYGVLARINGEVEGAFPAYGDLNLIVGAMLLIVIINILIKLRLDKRAEE